MPANDRQPDLDEFLRPESTADNQLLARLCHPSTVIANQLLTNLGLTMWPQASDPFEEDATWIAPIPGSP